MASGYFSVPSRRLAKFSTVLESLWESRRSVRARVVAAAVGHILSMRLAIGPVARLWTRALYRLIADIPHFSVHVHLDQDACREVVFWKDCFAQPVKFPIWTVSPKVEVISFSDASNVAWGGCLTVGGEQVNAHGNWEISEQGPRTSSTWRELRAVGMFIQATANFLAGKVVCHNTDNQNCIKHFIRFEVRWIPRELNQQADYLSKYLCRDDYRLARVVFQFLDRMWGPHSVDWFASHLSAQLPRFYAQFWCPGCEGVNAFSESWSDRLGWFFPPPFLLSRVLEQMLYCGAEGTVVAPYWPSQRWWPCLAPDGVTPAWFILDWRDLPVTSSLFIPCGGVDNCFTNGTLTSRVLVLRVSFKQGRQTERGSSILFSAYRPLSALGSMTQR